MKIGKLGRRIACYVLSAMMVVGMAVPQTVPAYADTTGKTFEVDLGEVTRNSSTITFPNATISTTGSDKVTTMTISVDKGYINTGTIGSGVSYMTDKKTYHQTVTCYWNSGTSVSTAQNLMRNITFAHEDGMKVTITIDGNYVNLPSGTVTTFTPAQIDGTANIAGTTHYYIYVADKMKWSEAYDKAKGYYFMGMQGYLATITEINEDIALDNIATDGAWAGGLRLASSTSTFDYNKAENYTKPSQTSGTCWFWVNGPESGLKIPDNASTDTKNDNSNHQVTATYATDPGVAPYSNWRRVLKNGSLDTDNQEPNNYNNREYCLQIHYPDSTSYAQNRDDGAKLGWNDLDDDPSNYNDSARKGYFVEFSKYEGENYYAGYSENNMTTVTKDVDHTHDWVITADNNFYTFTIACSGCDAKHSTSVAAFAKEYDGTDYNRCSCDTILSEFNGNSDGVDGYGYKLEYYVKNDTSGEFEKFDKTGHVAPYMVGDIYHYKAVVKLTKDGTVCQKSGKDIQIEMPFAIEQANTTFTAKAQTIDAGEDLETGKEWVEESYSLATGDRLEDITITKNTTTGKADPSDAVILNADNEDVTDCYNITYVSAPYTSNKKTPHIASGFELGCNEIIYGAKLKESTFTGGKVVYTRSGVDTEVEGTWSWKTTTGVDPDTTIPDVINNSENTEYVAVFTPSDTDTYNSIETKLKVKVNPKPVHIDWTVGTYTYDGNEHIPTAEVDPDEIAGLAEPGLSVTGAKTYPNGESNPTYEATAALTGTNAGNYVIATDEPERSTKKNFTIGKATLEIWLNDQNVDRKANLLQGTSAIKAKSGLIGSDYIGDIYVSRGTDGTSGEATVEYKNGDTLIVMRGSDHVQGDYIITVHPGKLTENLIELDSSNVTTAPTAGEITYGDSLESSTITDGVVKDGDYTVTGTWSWKEKNTKPDVSDSDDTEYVLVFTPTGDDAKDYKPFEYPVTLKVKPKEIDINWYNLEFGYDGNNHKPTASVSGQLPGDTVTATVAGEKLHAGTYTATVTIDNDNYVIKSGSESEEFVIKQKDLEITLDAQNSIKKQPLTKTGTDAIKETSGLVTGDEITAIEAKKGGTEATPQVVAEVSSVVIKNGSDVRTADYNITIIPGNLTDAKIVLEDSDVINPPTVEEITYGDTLNDSEITPGTIKDGDHTVTGTWSWKEKDTKPNVSDSNVTEYVLVFTPTGDDAKDYEPYEYKTKLLVKPKAIDIEWSNLEFTYNGEEHKPTATPTGYLTGDEVLATVTGAEVDANNGRTYTATAALSNPNYAIASGKETQNFVIKPKELIIQLKDQDSIINQPLTYTGINAIDNANTTGLVDGDTIAEIEVEKGGTNETEVVYVDGTAKIKRGTSDITYNYIITVKPGTLNNDRITLTEANIDPNNKPSAEDITYTTPLSGSDIVPGKVIDGTHEVEGTWTWEKVGTTDPSGVYPEVDNTEEYVVKFTPTGDDADDYKPFTTKLKVKVNPCAINLVWSNNQFTYDGTAHKPTATPTGVKDGDTVNATVSGEQTDANHGTETEYTATAELDNKNYSIKTESKTYKFTIVPRNLTIQLKDQECTKKQPLTDNGTAAIDDSKTEGLVAGDTVAAIEVKKNGTDETEVVYVDNTAVIERGSDVITYNYNITVNPGKLTSHKITLTEANIDPNNKPSAKDITYTTPLSGSDIVPGKVMDGNHEVEGTWTWEKVGSNDPTEVYPEVDNTEEYVVKFTPTGDDAKDYEPFTTKLKVKVNPYAIDVTWSDDKFTYDGTSHKPTATPTGVKPGDSVEAIVSGEKTDANHGTETEYTATAELNNINYSIKTESKTHKFTIEPRDLTIQLKDQKIIKHQSLPQGKDTVDNSKTLGLVAADFVSDIQIQKSATGLQVEGVEGTAKIGRTNATETEDITYNYNITVLPGNLEEEKIVLKPENVTTPPTASDIIYGDSLDDSEITGGVVKDDDDREVKGTWTWKKVDGKDPEDVNPQVKDEGSEEQYIAIFTPDPDYADDYTGFEFPVTLKVKPKEVELEWSDDLFVYDGDPHKPKAVVSKGIFGSDTVNAIVGDSYAKTEVGDDYEATAKLDNKNYTIKQGQEKHKFRITPKSIKDPTIDITITYSPTDDDVLIIEIIDNGKKNDGKLIENTDYMLDIKSDPNDEFSNVTITGIGNYGKEYKTTVKNQKWTGSVLSVITVDEEARELNPHMTKVSEDSAIAMFINEIDNNQKATDEQKNEAKAIVNEIQNSPTHESDDGSYRAVVTLEMQKMDEAQVEAIDVTEVKNYIGTNGIPKSAKIGQYLNLSLWIQYIVERKSPSETLVFGKTEIHDTTVSKLGNNSFEEEITITVPKELRPKKGYSRTYYIVRVHHLENGTDIETISLPVKRNGYELTFATDKFSTYALLYTEKKNPTNDPKGGNNDVDDPEPAKPANKPAPTKVTAPKTSDTADVYVAFGMVFMGLILLLACYIVNRKLDKEILTGGRKRI